MIGAAVLVAAILVVAIGFSSDDVTRVPAAAELDRSADPAAPRAVKPGSGAAPDSASPALAPQAAPRIVEAAAPPAAEQRTTDAAPPPAAAPPPEEGRAAAVAPTPTPRPRLRSQVASSPARVNATHDPGRAKPAGHSRARGPRPLTYDPEALFPDKH